MKKTFFMLLLFVCYVPIIYAQVQTNDDNCDLDNKVRQLFFDSKYTQLEKSFQEVPVSDFMVLCDKAHKEEYITYKQIDSLTNLMLNYKRKNNILEHKAYDKKIALLLKMLDLNPKDKEIKKELSLMYKGKGDEKYYDNKYKSALLYYKKSMQYTLSNATSQKKYLNNKISSCNVLLQLNEQQRIKRRKKQRRHKFKIGPTYTIERAIGNTKIKSINGNDLYIHPDDTIKMTTHKLGVNLYLENLEYNRTLNFLLRTTYNFDRGSIFKNQSIELNPNVLIRLGYSNDIITLNDYFVLYIGYSYVVRLKSEFINNFYQLHIRDTEMFNNLHKLNIGFGIVSSENGISISIQYHRALNNLFNNDYCANIDGVTIPLFSNISSKLNLLSLSITYKIH